MEGLVDGVLVGEFDIMDLGSVAEAAAKGRLLGAAGLILPHQIVTGYAAEVRARIGQILQLLPRVYVMDALSQEWLPHLALTGEKGGHPGWLADPEDFAPQPVCTNIKQAFQAAIRQQPFLLLIQGSAGCADELALGGQDVSYLPLYRWAREYGALEAVCTSQRETTTKEAFVMPIDTVRREQERAKATLNMLRRTAAGADVVELVDAVLDTGGNDEPAPPPGMRRMEIGSVFDPTTHYDDYYYGVDGKCILYPRPDGSWSQYRGTAHSWEGNKTIAKLLRTMLTGETLLDLGCGAGDFVEQARQVGFEAYGVDISAEAVRRAPPKVQARLRAADLTRDTIAKHDIVTAFDFWEHIWNKDVDALIRGVAQALPRGGLHVAVICTRGATEGDYVFGPGVEVNSANGWILVSGHVNIRRWAWWARKFKEHGFRLRHDLMQLFQVFRAEDGGLRTCESWSARNFLVVEKVL